MKSFLVIFIILIKFVYASENIESNLLLEKNEKLIKNESNYGITNSYSYFLIGQSIKNDDTIFYYGTNLNLMTEKITDSNKWNCIIPENFNYDFSAKFGLKINLEENEDFGIELKYKKDDLYDRSLENNDININYQYKF